MKVSSKITLVLAVLVAAFFAYALFRPNSFSDIDVTNTEAAIKTEFGKRDGVTVEEVTLMRETPRKLMGYVKLRFGELGITKECSATLGDGRYIWKCE